MVPGFAVGVFAGGGACVLAGLWLWRSLPLLRTHIRPIYIQLGIITE